jgi:hypothetical protein
MLLRLRAVFVRRAGEEENPGGLGAVRLRLPAERERRALKLTGLHDDLVANCARPLADATGATRAAIPADAAHVDLDAACESLVANLKLQPRVQEAIERAAAEPDSVYVEDDLYEIVARWVIDMQIGDGLTWDATAKIKRPR